MELLNAPAIRAQSVMNLGFLIPVLIFLDLFWVARETFHRFPWVAFCLGWMGLALSPVANLIPNMSLMCEKYAYLSSIGFVWLLVSFGMTLQNTRNTQSFGKMNDQKVRRSNQFRTSEVPKFRLSSYLSFLSVPYSFFLVF